MKVCVKIDRTVARSLQVLEITCSAYSAGSTFIREFPVRSALPSAASANFRNSEIPKFRQKNDNQNVNTICATLNTLNRLILTPKHSLTVSLPAAYLAQHPKTPKTKNTVTLPAFSSPPLCTSAFSISGTWLRSISGTWSFASSRWRPRGGWSGPASR